VERQNVLQDKLKVTLGPWMSDLFAHIHDVESDNAVTL
jgi:hypothetical protein